MSDYMAPDGSPSAVLIVDDDPDVLAAISEVLSGEDCELVCCPSAAVALAALEERCFSVAIVDQNMPLINGLQLLEELRQRDPFCSRILITGGAGPETLIDAINRGEIYRFLSKPWSNSGLLATVKNAVHRHLILLENERLLQEATELNRRLEVTNEELRKNLSALGGAHGVPSVSPQNFEHSLGLCFRLLNTFYPLLGRQAQSVVELCRAMAASEYFTENERHVLMTSAWIFDIGLVALDRSLLHRLFNRPEKCTPEEQALLRHHPIIGQTLAAFVDELADVGVTIRAHHERYDGQGYPDGYAGEIIPWTARCLAVAVAYVQSGLSKELACDFIRGESGRAFDPEAVRLFFRCNHLSNLPKNVREVLLSELKPGMELARGVVTPSGILLVPEGKALDVYSIIKLTNHSRLHLVTERLLVYAE